MTTQAPKNQKVTNYEKEFYTHLFFNVNRELKIDFDSLNENILDEIRTQKVINFAFQDLKEWNYQTEYQKRFYIVRSNQTLDALKRTVSYRGYRDYIAETVKEVYEEYYDVNDFHGSASTDEIESVMMKRVPELYNDLFCEDRIVAAISFSEIVEKVIEGDMSNIFGLFDFSYTHYLNYRLSPITVGIAFYNFKLLNMKKDSSNDREKQKSSLPKITYIHFVGYYSEIDIDILYQTSDNIQVIMIYDMRSGGPSFDKIDPLNEVFLEGSKNKRSILQISENILLLPLECSTGGVIDSGEISNLFESIVYRSIRKFKPELVVFNHSFNFHESESCDEKFPFILKVSTMQKILYELSIISQNKIMIVPHKLVEVNQYLSRTNFKTENTDFNTFLKGSMKIYSRPWNIRYFTDCYVSSLEILTGIKTYEKPKKNSTRLLVNLNTKFQIQLANILKCYQNHTLYDFLFNENSKLIHRSNRFLQEQEIKGILSDRSLLLDDKLSGLTFSSHETQIKDTLSEFRTNTVVLLIPDKLPTQETINNSNVKDAVMEADLYFEKGIPVLPLKKSQYILDSKNMTLYYFNLWYNGGFVHYKFKIPVMSSSSSSSDGKVDIVGTKLPEHPIQIDNKSKTLFNLGLCVGNNRVFWIYGKSSCPNSKKDSQRIFYYDDNTFTWSEVKVVGSDPKTKQVFQNRYNVTCTYFNADSGDRIYIFGGISDEYSLSGKLKIYNTVELLIMDFATNEFAYHFFDKEKLRKNQICYIPYTGSQAIQFKKKILIVGGRHFKNSVWETEEKKLFLFDTEKFEFTLISPRSQINICNKTNFNKKSSSDSFQIFSDSPYIFEKEGLKYLFNSLTNSCYSLAEVSLFETQNGDKNETNIKIYAYNHNKKKLLPFERSLKGSHVPNETYFVDADLSTIVNVFEDEPVETYLFFNFIVKCLKNYCQRNNNTLDETVFIKFLKKIIEDPLIKTGLLRRGIIEVYSLFDLKNFELKSKIDKLSKDISYVPTQREGNKKRIYAKITKLALSNNVNEKEQFIKISDKIFQDVLTRRGRKHIKSALNIDRIFQRNNLLKDYHVPQFSNILHHWFTEDLSEIFILSKDDIDNQTKSYVEKIDLGILRDICLILIRVFDFFKNKNSSESKDNVILIDDIEEKECLYWKDEERDKLSQEANIVLPKNSNIQDEIVDGICIDKIRKTLVICLTELASKEKINPEEITLKRDTNVINPALNKWFKFSQSQPEIWREIALNLGYEDFHQVVASQALEEDKHSKIKEIEQKSEDLSQSSSMYYSFIEVIKSKEKKDECEKNSIYQSNYSSPKSKITESGFLETKELNIKKENKIAFETNLGSITVKDKVAKRDNLLLMESVLVCPRLKNKINYHSLSNMKEAHKRSKKEIRDVQYFLSLSGSELFCQLESKISKCKLFLYDKGTEMVFQILLEKYQTKSLCIWNSIIYLFLDNIMAKRFLPSHLQKKYSNCLFYSDLTQCLSEDGQTKDSVVFTSVLRNHDFDITNRAIIADDNGIYIIGGMMTRKNRKMPIIPTNYCSYYDIDLIEELTTDVVEGSFDEIQIKRYNPVIAQTQTRLFVTDETNENSKDKDSLVIEVFDKEDFNWVYAFKIKTDSQMTSYNLSQINYEGEDVLVIIGHVFGKFSTGYIVYLDKLEQQQQQNCDDYVLTSGVEKAVKKIENLKIKSLKSSPLIYTGFENFKLLNNYSDEETLTIGDFKTDVFAKISFTE